MTIYRISYYILYGEDYPDTDFTYIFDGTDSFFIKEDEYLVAYDGDTEALQKHILNNFNKICPKFKNNNICKLKYCISEVTKENLVVCKIDTKDDIDTLLWLKKYWGVEFEVPDSDKEHE